MESHNQRRKCCVTEGRICWVSARPGRAAQERAIWCRPPAGYRKNLEINTDFWILTFAGILFVFLFAVPALVGWHWTAVSPSRWCWDCWGQHWWWRSRAGRPLGRGQLERCSETRSRPTPARKLQEEEAVSGIRIKYIMYLCNRETHWVILQITCRDLNSLDEILFYYYSSVPNLLYFYHLEWLNRCIM